jgi:DNA-binding MarR family transcriptional regulator
MDHYSSATYSPTQSVGFQLSKARNLIIAEMDRSLKELRITSRQMGILLAIQRGAATTPVELAKRLSVDAGLMTRMLDKLETKELLKRSRSTDDRRVVNLELTEKGHEVAVRIPQITPSLLDGRLKRFTQAEFEELNRLLHKFIGE